MFQAIELSAQLAQERIEREIARSAERRRLASEPSLSIRRTIGYRFGQFFHFLFGDKLIAGRKELRKNHQVTLRLA